MVTAVFLFVFVPGPNLEATGVVFSGVGAGGLRSGWGDGCFGTNVFCMGGGRLTTSTGLGLGCLTGSTSFGC